MAIYPHCEYLWDSPIISGSDILEVTYGSDWVSSILAVNKPANWSDDILELNNNLWTWAWWTHSSWTYSVWLSEYQIYSATLQEWTQAPYTINFTQTSCYDLPKRSEYLQLSGEQVFNRSDLLEIASVETVLITIIIWFIWAKKFFK